MDEKRTVPDEYATWPAEIRALYDVADVPGDAESATAALEHLFHLAGGNEDPETAAAARWAVLQLLSRHVPDLMAQRLIGRDRGASAVDFAAKLLASSETEPATAEKAERLIATVTSKFPPKGRA
jgi:hypothetical protein